MGSSQASTYRGAWQCQDVVTIDLDSSVLDAVRRMKEANVGSVIVVDGLGKLAGILTQRDVLHRAIEISTDLSLVPVHRVMTANVQTCGPHTAMTEAAELMAQRGIRHLPVVRNGEAVGMISSRDVLACQLNNARSAHAAAEQVARLLASLKSLEFHDVIEMVTSQLPKIFQADRCVLVLPPQKLDGAEPPLISRRDCSCQGEDLLKKANDADCSLPAGCRRQGAEGQAVRIHLDLHGLSPGQSRQALLCMCGRRCGAGENPDLLHYKRELVRQILSSNLSTACRYQEVKETLLVDSLTGVGNRRFFETRLQEEWRRAQRYGRPFCVAILDVDHFKAINDRFGHLAGDQALKQLADCVRKIKRSCDVLARFGGDEFMLLLPETTLRNATRVLERIRLAVQDLPGPGGQPLSISCGLEEGSSAAANEALRRADRALYEAKHAGRNQVRTWQEVSQNAGEGGIETGQTREMQDRLRSMSMQCKEIFLQSIGGLVRAIEARDPYTRSHSENVMRYAMGIAEVMNIPADEAALVRRSAIIHDLGKIGIPDAILRKQGKLTVQERSIMEQHPLVAVRILAEMEFLGGELPIVRHHHEWWDGHGYPDGISGLGIPRGSRILAVADAFDAITSDRVYHTGRSLGEAMQEIQRSSQHQFDPEVVAAIVSWVDQVRGRLGVGAEVSPRDLLEAQKGCSLVA